MRFTELDNFCFSSGLAFLEHHGCRYRLTPLLIGDAKHGSFQNFWVHVEHIFDFGRIHILSAGDNHVFFTVHNVDIPLGIDNCQVSGAKPSIRKCLFGFFLQVPVSGSDGVTAHPDFSNLFFVGGHWVSGLVHHF